MVREKCVCVESAVVIVPSSGQHPRPSPSAGGGLRSAAGSPLLPISPPPPVLPVVCADPLPRVQKGSSQLGSGAGGLWTEVVRGRSPVLGES